MKLPLKLAKTLQQLIHEGELPYKEFNKKLVYQFIEDGVLESYFLAKNKQIVKLADREYLANYLFNQYNIPDLEAYIRVMNKEETAKSEPVKKPVEAKTKPLEIFSGFLVNTYEEIYGVLKGERILLKASPGSFIFINDYENFSVPEDITIVVIENFESFKYIKAQKTLFQNDKYLFTWRYQNNALSEWLSTLPNEYIHFGDFDLAGLNEYLNFKQKRKGLKSTFLIPENIDELMEKYGNHERYLKQSDYVKNIDFSVYKDTSFMAEKINTHQKSLEQEIFINMIDFSPGEFSGQNLIKAEQHQKK